MPGVPHQVPDNGRRLRGIGIYPAGRGGPFKRQVDDAARLRYRRKGLQRRAQDGSLALAIASLTQQVA